MMVQGIDQLRRRFERVAPELRKQLRPELEAIARQIVAQMETLKPNAAIAIKWKWGGAPGGSIVLGAVAGAASDSEKISIYATVQTSEYPGGFPALARWFEFGTRERFHKSGKSVGSITAQPFFFPVYRANKPTIRRRIARKVNQAARAL
jgi:hypothetical protein